MRRSVVLPAPFGPTSAILAPCGISTVMPPKISSAPKALPTRVAVKIDIQLPKPHKIATPLYHEQYGPVAGEPCTVIFVRGQIRLEIVEVHDEQIASSIFGPQRFSQTRSPNYHDSEPDAAR